MLWFEREKPKESTSLSEGEKSKEELVSSNPKGKDGKDRAVVFVYH